MLILTIANQAGLHPLSSVSPWVVDRLKARLIFSNPAWVENQKRGFSNWRVPEVLSYYHIQGDCLTMPRGFARASDKDIEQPWH